MTIFFHNIIITTLLRCNKARAITSLLVIANDLWLADYYVVIFIYIDGGGGSDDEILCQLCT